MKNNIEKEYIIDNLIAKIVFIDKMVKSEGFKIMMIKNLIAPYRKEPEIINKLLKFFENKDLGIFKILDYILKRF